MKSTLKLTIRSATEVGDQRILEGIASTGEVDRMGDIVEPLGMLNRAGSTVPLLLGHDASRPVGRVTLGKPTSKGVPFTAKIARIDEPGTLQDRTNEAWQSVKHGIIDAVSIGFRPIKDAFERIETGLRFLKWEMLELSVVAIPANPGARILETRAAGGGALTVSAARARLAEIEVGGARPLSAVKLTAADRIRGQIIHESNQRIAADRRRGIPPPIVKLDPRYLTPQGRRELAILTEGEELLKRIDARQAARAEVAASGRTGAGRRHVVRLSDAEFARMSPGARRS